MPRSRGPRLGSRKKAPHEEEMRLRSQRDRPVRRKLIVQRVVGQAWKSRPEGQPEREM